MLLCMSLLHPSIRKRRCLYCCKKCKPYGHEPGDWITMLKQVKFEKASGKTIKKVKNSYDCPPAIFILYDDDTFSALTTYQSYDDFAKIVDSYVDILDHTDATIALGIVTKEEVKAARKEKENEQKKDIEECERKQYEQLKKKYGG